MKMVVGNWKMNGLQQNVDELKLLRTLPKPPNAEIIVCPPLTLVRDCLEFLASQNVDWIRIGAQDCHTEQVAGAYTGDVSAWMLLDAGIRHVIVGHSERRAGHGETDAIVQKKADAAIRSALLPILCIGETLAERQAGETTAVLTRQLKESIPGYASAEQLVIAYEPVWAIGTGLTPTLGEVEDSMKAIHAVVGSDFRILYGGSVKPDNAGDLMAVRGVSGVLVGGASLKGWDFHNICMAAG